MSLTEFCIHFFPSQKISPKELDRIYSSEMAKLLAAGTDTPIDHIDVLNCGKPHGYLNHKKFLAENST